VTLAEFYALIAGVEPRHRPLLARIAWRYQDLRFRGFTRPQARAAVLDRPEFDFILRGLALRDEFRSITD
jgi:hypothetical protein